MNFGRIALAAFGGLVAYLALGFLMFAVMPTMKSEFAKYPAVFRSQEAMMGLMPVSYTHLTLPTILRV